MADNLVFNNPYSFGVFDITTSQKDKTMQFAWDATVLDAAKVVAKFNDTIVKSYTVGNGLALSNASQTVTLTLQGVDFVNYIGRTLNFKCNFFVEGDVEVIFDLKILKGDI